LSEAIIAPIAERLRAKRIFLVTDDVLQEVAFPGLPWPAGPRTMAPTPLVERFEITSIPSASALAAMRALRRPQAAPKEIAIFADPKLQPGKWGSLKASGDEANRIATLVPGEKVSKFLDVDANVTALENSHLENFRHILFATHAFVDEKHPDLSGIVLSDVDGSGNPRNGILPLLDIYGMSLRADMVVLSTCVSAEGRNVPGEGLLALSRGFLYAGARAVIATLWEVRSAPSATLIGEVYLRVLGPQKAHGATALRDAQLALWRQGRSPRRWAAFIMIGDPD